MSRERCMTVSLPPRRELHSKLTSDSLSEKPGRGNLFTNVTRHLGPDKIVVCDSLNYIKGFRYQMYCAAREAHARTVTVSSPTLASAFWLMRRFTSRRRLIDVESGTRSGESARTSPTRERSC